MITLSEIQPKIAEAIRQSGLTQNALALKIGVKQQTIAQYLSGRAMPALDTFANLCAVLEVSADYLLGLEDETGSKTYNNYGIHNGNVKF